MQANSTVVHSRPSVIPTLAPGSRSPVRVARTIPAPPPTHFVVVDSCARMPRSCWGRYRRVAVLECVAGYVPTRIDARGRGVVRIVRRWERLFDGTTDRCAYATARREADALAEALNAIAARSEVAAAPAELHTEAAE